ncbi:MAG: ACT domain-containing protein [Clostridia bacterium]|nr:ACT domain-containing protein [Clostridia bacterium]
MKAFITVLGRDRRGIIAAVSAKLLEYGVNILDITQTVLQNNFTMIMFVELEDPSVTIEMLSDAMDEVAKDISMVIRVQREDIFDSMNRI